MSILYSYHKGRYIGTQELLNEGGKHRIDKIYVNITNQCPCRCTFCIRSQENAAEFDDLWLTAEPAVEEVLQEFDRLDLTPIKEVIFCGYGEPLTRLKEVLEISKALKSRKNLKIRINTNGLGSLIHGFDIVPALKNFIDSISISLNASNAAEYLKLTRSSFGMESYDAVIRFAVECRDQLKEVRVTVVDIIGREEIEKCRELCDAHRLDLVVRKFIMTL
jgi:TatD family-associated radical SAM protein